MNGRQIRLDLPDGGEYPRDMIKVLLVIAGLLLLAFGFVGILLPGLPTTPFLLVSAACFVRSSDRLYSWLIRNRLFGPYIRRYRETKAMSLQSKIAAMGIMWTMITVSCVFLVHSKPIIFGVLLLGVIGSIVLVFVIKTER